MKPRIIVLTPVKNEAAILERFLSVTSRFADEILIADQLSTDSSREICLKYKKVTLLQNTCPDYDEARRQLLLISEARKIWPGPKILLGLDADEVLAADAMLSADWETMLSAAPGTILLFEKPDLLPGLKTCLRYFTNPMPLGFVDDGVAIHKPLPIHSPRVPQPLNAPRLFLPGIKIMHYGTARIRTQLAKARFYSVQENLKNLTPLRRRRKWYGNLIEKFYQLNTLNAYNIPREWLEGWELLGIDMHHFDPEPITWHEVEVLKAFSQHGERRFWLEPIWDIDWNDLRKHAASIEGIPHQRINPPSPIYRAMASCIDLIINFIERMPWFKVVCKKLNFLELTFPHVVVNPTFYVKKQ